MKALIIASLLFGFLAGCSKENTHDWFIQSYDKGIITVRHEGKVFQARCSSTFQFDNRYPIGDEKSAVVLQTCDPVMDFVGTSVQPFESSKKDAKSSMANIEGALYFTGRQDKFRWVRIAFVITSVTMKPKGETP